MQELPKGKLAGALPPAIVMTVTIAATTTTGTPLSTPQWEGVIRACDLAERLDEYRKRVRNVAYHHLPIFDEWHADLQLRSITDVRTGSEHFGDRWLNCCC